MQFLYEHQEVEQYHNTWIRAQDKDKMPRALEKDNRGTWLQIIKIEHKNPYRPAKKPIAEIDERGNPVVTWVQDKRVFDDWDLWCKEGWDHKGNLELGTWSRKNMSGAWFITFHDLETFVDFCEGWGGIEIYEDRERSHSDGRDWKPILVLRTGVS